jgi:hypothetical protein
MMHLVAEVRVQGSEFRDQGSEIRVKGREPVDSYVLPSALRPLLSLLYV